MNPVTELFSKPGCYPCKSVEARLIKYGIPYIKHDITQDADAYDRVRQLGYSGVPVIIQPDGESFHGYQPARIKALLDD